MGDVVSTIGNVVSSVVAAPFAAVSGLMGGNKQSLPTPPKPPEPLAPNIPAPGSDVVKARQDRIRQQEALGYSSGVGPASTLTTGAQGDLSLSNTNKKTLLGQ